MEEKLVLQVYMTLMKMKMLDLDPSVVPLAPLRGNHSYWMRQGIFPELWIPTIIGISLLWIGPDNRGHFGSRKMKILSRMV